MIVKYKRKIIVYFDSSVSYATYSVYTCSRLHFIIDTFVFLFQSEAAISALSIAADVYLGAAVLVSTLCLIYILKNI